MKVICCAVIRLRFIGHICAAINQVSDDKILSSCRTEGGRGKWSVINADGGWDAVGLDQAGVSSRTQSPQIRRYSHLLCKQFLVQRLHYPYIIRRNWQVMKRFSSFTLKKCAGLLQAVRLLMLMNLIWPPLPPVWRGRVIRSIFRRYSCCFEAGGCLKALIWLLALTVRKSSLSPGQNWCGGGDMRNSAWHSGFLQFSLNTFLV